MTMFDGGLDLTRISRIEAYLLRCRMLYSRAPEGRRLTDLEADMAGAMQSLGDEEYDLLYQLLRGKGYGLRAHDATTPGVPRGGQCWLIVREPGYDGPELLTTQRMWKLCALRSDEPKAVTVYWVTFLWFVTMSFLYDRPGRALSEVSEYLTPVFTRDELEAKVREILEELRTAGLHADGAGAPVAAALLGGAEAERATATKDVKRRVKRFLDMMLEARMLDRLSGGDEDIYRQSLLCAEQMAELGTTEVASFMSKARVSQEAHLLAGAVEEFTAADPRDAAIGSDEDDDAEGDDHGAD